MNTTLVLPTVFNLAEDPKMLSLLYKFYDEEPFELVIISDNHNRKTQDMMINYQDSYPGITLIIRNEPMGLSNAFNVGLKYAVDFTDAQNIGMIADDIYVSSGWLKYMVKALRDHPSYGWVSSVQSNHESYPFTAMCSLFIRDIMETIGYFDEYVSEGCCFDDEDMILRLWDAGYTPCSVKESQVYHYGTGLTVEKIWDKKPNATDGIFEQNYKRMCNKWGKDRLDNFKWSDISIKSVMEE